MPCVHCYNCNIRWYHIYTACRMWNGAGDNILKELSAWIMIMLHLRIQRVLNRKSKVYGIHPSCAIQWHSGDVNRPGCGTSIPAGDARLQWLLARLTDTLYGLRVPMIRTRVMWCDIEGQLCKQRFVIPMSQHQHHPPTLCIIVRGLPSKNRTGTDKNRTNCERCAQDKHDKKLGVPSWLIWRKIIKIIEMSVKCVFFASLKFNFIWILLFLKFLYWYWLVV